MRTTTTLGLLVGLLVVSTNVVAGWAIDAYGEYRQEIDNSRQEVTEDSYNTVNDVEYNSGDGGNGTGGAACTNSTNVNVMSDGNCQGGDGTGGKGGGDNPGGDGKGKDGSSGGP